MSNMQFDNPVNRILGKKDIFEIKNEINRVNMSESLERYIIELVFATNQ